MSAKGLWIDDSPRDLALFRSSLIESGMYLTVATSHYEAKHHLSGRGFSCIFMRPDLRVDGSGYYDLKRDASMPFFKEMYDQIRSEQGWHLKKPLYLLLDHYWFDEKAEKARETLKLQGVEREGDYSVKGDPLTKIIYTKDLRPAKFSRHIKEEMVRREAW